MEWLIAISIATKTAIAVVISNAIVISIVVIAIQTLTI